MSLYDCMGGHIINWTYDSDSGRVDKEVDNERHNYSIYPNFQPNILMEEGGCCNLLSLK